jgi:hypothetical protein
MRLITTLLFVTSLIFCSAIMAQEEKLEQTVEGVELYQMDKYNAEGHNFGTDYVVYNRNDYPVLISIELVEKRNLLDGLLIGVIRVEPGEKAYLGWLIQSDPEYDSDWRIQWWVDKVESSPKTYMQPY